MRHVVGHNRYNERGDLTRSGVRIMSPFIEQHRDAIRALARAYGVDRLEIFGSATTPDFDPTHSDVDFLVEYPPDYDFGPWLARFQELQRALEDLIGRKVDLVMTSALRDPWFRREAEKTRTVVYDAAETEEVAYGSRRRV
jgi:predicted nucleotidyltransferase